MHVVFRDMWSQEDVPGIFAQMKLHFGNRKKRFLIANLADAPPQQYSKEMRNLLAVEISEFPIHKISFVGANPALRIMAKFLLGVIGTTPPMEAAFFKSEEEAVSWLKNDI